MSNDEIVTMVNKINSNRERNVENMNNSEQEFIYKINNYYDNIIARRTNQVVKMELDNDCDVRDTVYNPMRYSPSHR